MIFILLKDHLAQPQPKRQQIAYIRQKHQKYIYTLPYDISILTFVILFRLPPEYLKNLAFLEMCTNWNNPYSRDMYELQAVALIGEVLYSY